MQTKKVFFVGIKAPGVDPKSMIKGFEENDYEVIFYDWQHKRFDNDVDFIRNDIVEKASEIKPDLIFLQIQNSEALRVEDYKKLQEKAFTVQYTFDVREKCEMQWMYHVAEVIGFTFFGCMEDVWACNAIGIKNVGHSHSSCDMELYKPNVKAQKIFDIVFCGNNYANTNLKFPLASERQAMIYFLKDKYGDQKFKSFGLGQDGGLIRPEVEATVYTHCKLAINQNNFILNEYTSDRLFRIMATGTLCLTRYFPNIEKFFTKGKHLDWFHTFEELTDLIDFYLFNPDWAAKVASAGTELVRTEHSWAKRIGGMKKIFGESKNPLHLV